MKIFGLEIRKAGIADNTPALTKKGWFFGSMGELPDTNVHLYYKYYRKNADIRRCIQEIQGNIGQDGYVIKKNGEAVAETPKEIKAIIDNGPGFGLLKGKIVRDVLVAGNAYIVKLRNQAGKMVGLDTVDPRTVKVISDEFGVIMEYVQEVNGKVYRRYKPNDIINCFNDLDPDNEIFGLSTIECIILEALSDDESAIMNYHYFKNSAVPSMLIKVSQGISDTELDNTLAQLKKNFGGWGKNKHKIGILQGVDGIEKVQDSITDMNFAILRWFNTNRICVAFGVPKAFIGYTDGVNYTNADIQYKKFITNSITPWEKSINSWITQALQEVDATLTFELYSTGIDTDKSKLEMYEIKIRNGLITINEAREEMGYDQYDLPEANEPLIGKTFDKLTDVWLTNIPTIWS